MLYVQPIDKPIREREREIKGVDTYVCIHKVDKGYRYACIKSKQGIDTYVLYLRTNTSTHIHARSEREAERHIGD